MNWLNSDRKSKCILTIFIIISIRRKKAENSWMLPGLDDQIEKDHKSVRISIF